MTRKESLRQKLRNVFAFAFMLLVLFFMLALYQRYHSQLEAAAQDAEHLAEVMQKDFTRVLTLDSMDDAADANARLDALPLVLQVQLFRPDGSLVYSYHKPGVGSEQIVRKNTAQWYKAGKHLVFNRMVRFQGEDFGEVRMRYSLALMLADVYREIWISLALMTFFLVIVWLLFRNLEIWIARPVLELADKVEDLGQNRDYQYRFETSREDEIGILFNGINRMLEEVDQAQQQLLQQGELREKILQETQTRYRFLLEHASDAFFLQNGRQEFVEVNKQACESLGYSREELLNKVHAGDIEVGADPAELEALHPMLRKGQIVHMEGVHKRKDGTHFPIEASLSMVNLNGEDMITILARDISERKRLENALRDSQYRMSIHIKRTPLAIIEWDYDYCVTAWNPAAEKMFGHMASDVLGKHISELMLRVEKPHHMDNYWRKNLKDSSSHESEHQIRTTDGRLVWTRWINTQLENEVGGVFGIASLVMDVSEQKKAEAALLQAKFDAEKANNAKSEFLSSMSHELRTPMNSILGFTQLIGLDKNLPDKHKDSLTEISKAGKHLLGLINEVLDLAKVESGQTGFVPTEVSLPALISECESLIKPQVEDHGLNLVIQDMKDYRVEVDEKRMTQILLNLLSNAVKYNRPDGEVRVTVEEVIPERVRINVYDTGPGIKPDEMDALFQPFNRLHAEHSNIEGTGIGLTLTRNLVELMNGRIGVESMPGEGSCFWVELPLCAETSGQKLTSEA